jgi:S-adenosylmethionine uptake transporter
VFNWFFEKGHKQGVLWAVMTYFVGTINDVFMKFLGSRLHWTEIAFFRFFFSSIVIFIPMLLPAYAGNFKSTRHLQHITRGVLGAIALGLCCLSVNMMPLAENTTILFCEAIFMLPLSVICLKEKIGTKSLIATVIGFFGLLIMFRPSPHNFNIMAIIPTVAALLFSYMNIMIKRMIDNKESMLTMLFYFGLYATITSCAALPFFWITPTLQEFYLLLLLGLGANVIQLFIFLAYRATTASTISPIRYTELMFAVLFGYVFFGQIPGLTVILGASLIICGSVLMTRKPTST